MKFATLIAGALAAVVSVVQAQAPPDVHALNYNVTLANAVRGKYTCLTTSKWLAMIQGPTGGCLKQPTITANLKDGCAYDDFACHCINYQRYSDIIEPLSFPPSLGGRGTCTLAQLGAVRPIVFEMCNSFNATQYAQYGTCPLWAPLFSWQQSMQTIAGEPINPYF